MHFKKYRFKCFHVSILSFFVALVASLAVVIVTIRARLCIVFIHNTYTLVWNVENVTKPFFTCFL